MFCEKVRETKVSNGYTVIANSDSVQVLAAKPRSLTRAIDFENLDLLLLSVKNVSAIEFRE